MNKRVAFIIKTLLKVTLITVPIVVIFSFTAIEYTSQPQFCTSCHIMQPYYDSWKTSSHSKVSCLECHFPPGIEGYVESKTQAISQVVKYFTKTYGTKPWAEISDKSCLRSGCHTERLLHGKVVFKGVVFDHQTHLTQLRRGKQLRCVSCHSQIVQGTHITVTETTCFLCHFKDLPEGEPISGCPSCHTAPTKTIEIQGVTFKHQDMIAQGVDCRRCHLDVIEGDGVVPRERCMGCHNEPERLAKYDDSVFMHKNHVTDHKVECTQCHLEILHKIKSMAEPLAINCQTCHPDHHAAQRELYMGVGGKGAAPKASPMFIARVSCEGCHIGHKGGEIEGITRVAEPAACMSCHGTSYAHIQDGWTQGMGNLINQLTPYLQLVATEVERTERAGTVNIGEAEKLHQRATHNIELVRYGKGAHNVEYSEQLIESARDDLDQALKSLGSAHRVPALEKPITPAGGACLSCHFGIETHTNEFGGRTFQHGRHTITAQLNCSVCHSSQPKGQPEHGKTTLTSTADCDGCHHRQVERSEISQSGTIDPTRNPPSIPPLQRGEGGISPARKVTCQTCHTSDELPRQIVYQQKAFNHDLHATQRGISCNACHAPNVQPIFKADCISCHHDETKVQVVAKCGTCHPNQTAMFEGTGYNIPSLKLAAQVTCEGCHQAETKTIGVATRNGCKSCHKTGDYAAVMDVWQTKARGALGELKVTEAKVAALLASLNVPEARQLYESAKKDINFVQADASFGVHNPELTDVLLKNARERLQKCLDLLSQAIQKK